jgi:hypothetical protein
VALVLHLEVENMATDTETPKKEPAFTMAGAPGFGFQISGKGFGATRGQVQIGGQIIPTSAWEDNSIKGILPADTKAGTPVVIVTTTGKLTGTYQTQR